MRNIKVQSLAVNNVLKEMEDAEKYMTEWGLSWTDQYLDAHCEEIHHSMPLNIVQEIEKKYYNRYALANAFYNSGSIGVPLETVSLEYDNRDYDVEFGKIKWSSVNSHKSKRDFTFNNNGWIEYSKQIKKHKPNSLSYYTYFNVLSADFNVEIKRFYVNSDSKVNYEGFDSIVFGIKDNILTITYNGVGKTIDLESGYEGVKSNNPNFYDSKLVENATNSSIEIIKTIKGELPLNGLVERIDYGLNILSNQKNISGRKR